MTFVSGHETRASLLRNCFLFADLEPDILIKVASVTTPQSFGKGQLLFERGDEPNGLFVVVDGLIRVWINSEDGRELTLNLIEPGDALGEIALLDGLPRTANATAIEASQTLCVPQSQFSALLDSEPGLARHIIELLCERLRRNTEDLSNFAFLDLRQRLAAKLVDLAFAHATITDNSARFHRRFSQTALAQMLAVSREAVNKALSALSQQDLVAIEGGMISIPDIEKLKNLVRAP
ncbi:Crp/Fnr family transcriptional regulator [Stappia sp. F7233]|uniref:Crp/Fnr family transcriptional regulator n=1 Tax=Stappia albiluteola TaxID=2758565 RepID=A0A839ADA4_9HYPH|nr:Crp/Fnr family transcriptional regulator [Stappia albiluteola]MBA5777126.1 Crp/Fnr family transcriptional regulator [Stappia albiluteola]